MRGDVEPRVVVGGVVGVVDALIPARLSLHLVRACLRIMVVDGLSYCLLNAPPSPTFLRTGGL